MFKHYTPDDFDRHGYLKAPLGFYGLLALTLRAYIVWVLTVANRSDATPLIQTLYPNKHDFFIGLATGAGAVLATALFSLRREKAFAWLPKAWPYSYWLLWISVIADLIVTVELIINSHFIFKLQNSLTLVGLLFAAMYLFKSRRLRAFFKDWPAAV